MPILALNQQENLRDRYARMRPGWQPSSQTYEDLVGSRLADGTRVLDVGCGRGGVLERLHGPERFSAGVDADPRSLLEHRMPKLVLAAALAEKLPFASGSFDLVICSWVLEHLRDPGTALVEFSRLLRRGGSFAFLTPNVRNPLVGLNRAMRLTKGRLVPRVYERADEDTFPVVYRANTVRQIDRLARGAGLLRRAVVTVGDPTYLAFTEGLFRLGCLLEKATPDWLQVHLVGEYVKA